MIANLPDIEFSGPVFDLINHALRDIPQYRAFCAGQLSRTDYCSWLQSGDLRPDDIGLNADQLNLSTRFPMDERSMVAHVLAQLRHDGVITSTDYPEAGFDEWRSRVVSTFDHAGQRTYIFPEEERLLFALSHIAAPTRAVFAGSYYGYWAVWAMPGILAAGGTATLIDIDPDNMALAERNFKAMGCADVVEFAVADAIEAGRGLETVDLCVLDAEGPKPTDALPTLSPDLIDKAIYYPIMEAITPAVRQGGVLVAHNVLLRNLTDNAYFEDRIVENKRQYAKFQQHLDGYYDVQRVLDTSEGTGVYRRRRPHASGPMPSTAS
ncbi:O-methyltransferase [Nocardia sp. NPDC050175]|uniref:O-methyltransferase n=1 Tax=Nocardia sp. NPDC050175 TaxID=3364317 RepID=UPI0037AF0266